MDRAELIEYYRNSTNVDWYDSQSVTSRLKLDDWETHSDWNGKITSLKDKSRRCDNAYKNATESDQLQMRATKRKQVTLELLENHLTDDIALQLVKKTRHRGNSILEANCTKEYLATISKEVVTNLEDVAQEFNTHLAACNLLPTRIVLEKLSGRKCEGCASVQCAIGDTNIAALVNDLQSLKNEKIRRLLEDLKTFFTHLHGYRVDRGSCNFPENESKVRNTPFCEKQEECQSSLAGGGTTPAFLGTSYLLEKDHRIAIKFAIGHTLNMLAKENKSSWKMSDIVKTAIKNIKSAENRQELCSSCHKSKSTKDDSSEICHCPECQGHIFVPAIFNNPFHNDETGCWKLDMSSFY